MLIYCQSRDQWFKAYYTNEVIRKLQSPTPTQYTCMYVNSCYRLITRLNKNTGTSSITLSLLTPSCPYHPPPPPPTIHIAISHAVSQNAILIVNYKQVGETISQVTSWSCTLLYDRSRKAFCGTIFLT